MVYKEVLLSSFSIFPFFISYFRHQEKKKKTQSQSKTQRKQISPFPHFDSLLLPEYWAQWGGKPLKSVQFLGGIKVVIKIIKGSIFGAAILIRLKLL